MEKKQSKKWPKIIAYVVLAIGLAIIVSAAYLLMDDDQQPYSNPDDLPDTVDDDLQDDGDDDDTDNDEPVYYHNVSSGVDDFWDDNPLDHAFPGTSVFHPSWVQFDLLSKPLLIFTHSEGCAPCITQTGICESIYEKYSSNITYYDILSGTDEPEATDTFTAYDPDGEPHFIPLTIVVTNGPNGSIIWHSWEGVVQESVLEVWILDAIAYHEANS